MKKVVVRRAMLTVIWFCLLTLALLAGPRVLLVASVTIWWIMQIADRKLGKRKGSMFSKKVTAYQESPSEK